MATAGLGFALTFVGGRGVLHLDGQPLGAVGRFERLELEIPGLRFPFDLSGGAARFQHRRCRLREAVLVVSPRDLDRLVRAAPMRAHGFSDVTVSAARGELRLVGRASFGGRTAPFTARGAFVAEGADCVRVSLWDVLVFGFLPVPAPLLPLGLFAALGARAAGAAEGGRTDVPTWLMRPEPLWRVVGPTDLAVDAVGIGLTAALPPAGWRLPGRQDVELSPVRAARDRFVWQVGTPGREGFEEPGAALAPGPPDELETGRLACAEAEAALLEADVPAARLAYERALDGGTGGLFAERRLLQILASSRQTLAEAAARARARLDDSPTDRQARVTLAMLEAEEGRAEDAARAFEAFASESELAGDAADAAAAVVAAAALWRQADFPGRAADALQAALADPQRGAPTLALAARALSDLYRDEGRWQDLLGLLRRRAAEEEDAAARAALYAESGFVFLDALGDADRARDRFEHALRVAPSEPAGWEGLGRVGLAGGADRAVARAALDRARAIYEARGDVVAQARLVTASALVDRDAGLWDTARAGLARAAALDEAAFAPLAAASEMEEAAGRPGEALRLLEAALGRATAAPDRSKLLRRLAALEEGRRDFLAVRMRLEQALDARPTDLEAMTSLLGLLDRRGEPEEGDARVRRAVAASAAAPRQESEGVRDLVALALDRGRRRGVDALVDEALARGAALGGEGAAEAALELAERALAEGATEAGAVARAAHALSVWLASHDEPRTGGLSARLWLSYGRLLVRLHDAGAGDAFRAALDADARGDVAAAAWAALVDGAHARGDATAAARALTAWADDPRTDEGPAVRATHLEAAARAWLDPLGRPADALPLLVRAVQLEPARDDTFELACDTALATAEWDALVGLLRGRLAGSPGVEEPALLRRLLAALEAAGRGDEVEETARRLLARAPHDVTARLALARRLWAAGHMQDSARELERVLEAEGPAAARAEAHLRLAQWARVAGRGTDVTRHLAASLALEGEGGAPPDVLAEVFEACGRVEDALAALAARGGRDAPPAARRAVSMARAGALERVGRSEEALALYESLLAGHAADVEPLARMAEIHRREARPSRLVAPLRRLFELAQARDLEADGALDAETIGLELAGVLEETASAAEAEAVLRRLVAVPSPSADTYEALVERLDARGAHADADALYERRVDLEDDPAGRASLLLGRARQLLSRPGAEAAAWAWVRRLDVEAVPLPALLERAALAEALGEPAEAAATLRVAIARGAAEPRVQREAVERIVALAQAAEPAVGGAWLEAAILDAAMHEASKDVASDFATLVDACFRIYEKLAEPAVRNAAWARLAAHVEGHGGVHAARIHTALAGIAEAEGFLPRAEDEYRKALAFESPPALRVEQLVGHARTLVAAKDLEDATADLDEALALDPGHARALLMAADLAHRAQDWERARRLYDALGAAPDRDTVVPPATLAWRRAELAEMFGAEAEAEAAYREVAAAEPGHVGAREALAQLAQFRDDLPEATRWIEELLAVYPPESAAKILDMRLQLGKLRARAGDLPAARRDLELVLVEEPDRISALEALVDVLVRLGETDGAAAAYGRLARAHDDPKAKAEASFRQGELLRTEAAEAADAAYLRAFDLDPTHEGTLQRVCEHYHREGDLENVVEIGRDLLARHGAEALAGDLGLLVALAAAAQPEPQVTLARAALSRGRPAPDTLAARLLELAASVGPRAVDTIDRVLRVVMDGAPEAERAAVERHLVAAIRDRPWRIEVALLIGRWADLRARPTLARCAYALVLFADPTSPLALRYGELPPVPAPPRTALSFGRLDHPACAGPVRAALAGAAAALAGLSFWAPAETQAETLAPEVLSLVADLWETLGGPPLIAVGRSAGTAVTVEGTQPVQLAVGARPEGGMISADLTFVLARAVELARGASFVLPALDGAGLRDLLIALAVAGHVLPLDEARRIGLRPRAEDFVAALMAPDRRAALPAGAARAAWLEAVRTAVSAPLSLEDFTFGVQATADRVGLHVCRDPFVAMAGVARAAADPDREPTVPTGTVRREQLQPGGRLHALVTYLLSDAYEKALEAPPS